MAGALVAVVLVALATVLREGLSHLLPGLSVFSLYFPAILASALAGGEAAAVVALFLSTAIGWGLLADNPGSLRPASVQVNVLLFVLSGAFIGGVGATLRRLMRRRRVDFLRLSDREARYRALFDGVAEGFALLETVRDAHGQLIDFAVVEANPALLRMFRLSPAVVGHRQSGYREPLGPEYLVACRRALEGEPVRFENYDASSKRWFDIRMNRVSPTLIAQIFVDITEQKAAETHKTEMFNELNHRVKNNLAAVSAMLSMQARAAGEPKLREQLEKAVDRIETIAEVHASLYRANSTGDVDFSAYLQRLCERLAASLVDKERVRVEVVAEPVTTPLAEAVALGLIVNELVTNAAKHAYPPPATGAVEVSLHHAPNELVLTVKDNGRGMAQASSAAGIGMRLVRSLVQQCRGVLETTNDTGATFIVRLPEHPMPTTETTQTQLL